MLRFIQEQVRAVNGPNIHARVDGAKTLGVAWLNTPETLSRQGRRGEVVSLPAFVLAHWNPCPLGAECSGRQVDRAVHVVELRPCQ